ncbi:MAG: ribose-5-phosphate isomerase RpiA [Pikeienuella sp.]
MDRAISAAEAAKRASALKAAEYVADGMKLGLGTGSTAAWLVKILGEKVGAGELSLTCVPTSSRTAEQAQKCGLTLATLEEVERLDLTIDGADEFDADLNLIKGGGGALLQEKIVATASDRMIVITDPSKRVRTLGAFPLPVEIVRFGWESTRAHIERALDRAEVGGRRITMRRNHDERFVTDEGHYILDLHLRHIGDPHRLSAAMTRIPGVVETGLFLNIADTIVIGHTTGEAEVVTGLTADSGSDSGDDDLFDDLG